MEPDEAQIVPILEEGETESSTISVIATFGILAMTVLATLGATLGAISASNENVSNRNRQIWASYSTAVTTQADQLQAINHERETTNTTDHWRHTFLTLLAASAVTPALKESLQGEIGQDSIEAATTPPPGSAPSPPLPPESQQSCPWSGDDTDISVITSQADCALQLATAYGNTAESQLRNALAFLAIVSMAAIALFLFALTKSLTLRSMQIMFVCVASALACICIGWGVFEWTFKRAAQPVAQAVQQYEEFHDRSATRLDPDLLAAWQALGTGPCAAAVADDQRALQLQKSSVDYNNLGTEEMQCGDLRDANTNLRSAVQADPRDDYALGSIAEYLLLTGHTKKALQKLSDVVCSNEIGYCDEGLRLAPHGSAYMGQWFQSLLQDEGWMVMKKGNVARDFFNVAKSEQSLFAIYDATGQVPPTIKQSETISHARYTIDPTISIASKTVGKGSAASPVDFTFSYAGLVKGDVVSIIWYDQQGYSGTVPFTASQPDSNRVSGVPTTVEVVGSPGGPQAEPAGVSGTFTTPGWIYADPSAYTVEIAVDSKPLKSLSVSVPAT